MNQRLERLSIDLANPVSIVVESNPDTEVGKVDNAANAKELVDAWNALVAATRAEP